MFNKIDKLRKQIMENAINNGFNAYTYKNKNGDDILVIKEDNENGN